jgi:hypothetical protein
VLVGVEVAFVSGRVDVGWQDFPADAESRIAQFTGSAAAASTNAQAERKLRELAETQASLHPLATLIARGVSPEAVFAAVTNEVLRHFGSGIARMIRYELDGTATLVANEGTIGSHVRVGERPRPALRPPRPRCGSTRAFRRNELHRPFSESSRPSFSRSVRRATRSPMCSAGSTAIAPAARSSPRFHRRFQGCVPASAAPQRPPT